MGYEDLKNSFFRKLKGWKIEGHVLQLEGIRNFAFLI